MKYINYLLDTAFILFFALALVIYFGLIKPYVVVSNSMYPNIPMGSLIFVMEASSYNVGDIVTYKQMGSSDTLVTHQIVSSEVIKSSLEISSIRYTTKGINNSFEDPISVVPSEIIGKVRFVVPNVGFYASSSYAIYIFYVVIGFLLGSKLSTFIYEIYFVKS